MGNRLNDTIITFRWNETNEKDIRSLARDYGVSLGFLIRRVLVAYLKSKNRFTNNDKEAYLDD